MIPTIIALGPLAIHSFGLMLVLALVAGWRTLFLSLLAAGENPALAERMVFWAGIGGVGGARLLYLISFASEVAADPLGAIFGGAGFVFYGGLIGGTLAVYILLRRVKKPFWRYADLVAPALAVGYAVGRIGCQLSGDGDYGLPTALPWGFSYLHGVVPTAPGVLVHPTPIYETLSALVIAWILLELQRSRLANRTGYIFGTYLALSAIARYGVEMLRIEPVVYAGLTEAQLISIALVLLGSFLMIRRSNIAV